MINKKSYKSDKIYAISGNVVSAIKTDDNTIHCIGTNYYHTFSLSEILPQHLFEGMLVFGYVDQFETDYEIPISMIQLIISYYPSTL